MRGNHVLFQFGTDFTWENAVNGTLFGEYFRYVDTIRDLLNADPKKRFRAFYSTPAEYFAAKLANVSSLPLVVSDFFPYNDDTVGPSNENGHNVWAGYFTSRPAFKVRSNKRGVLWFERSALAGHASPFPAGLRPRVERIHADGPAAPGVMGKLATRA